MTDARARLSSLAKPPGSLGRLEDLAAQLCDIARTCPPPPPRPVTVAVFAGDHGVLAQGVSPWPQEITASMVRTFTLGGAAVNVLARQVGADVVVVDVGIASPVDGAIDRNVRRATADLSIGPAMSLDEAKQAFDVGRDVARDATAGLLVTGDMGIGNTTPSAAIICALTAGDAATVTGRGTGIDDDTLALKTRIVADAAARVAGADAMTVLAEVGGLEIAAIAGFVTEAATRRIPVVVDGVIALAGLLVAATLDPAVLECVIAGHRSTEPGASAVLEHLGLEPLLDLGMRLGEGTGALLAVPIIQSAAALITEMATIAEVLDR
ncbi:MAG: nicotinate-nucleotide--dimethylbenzimidazole phosphoribosyltransferase [Actinomycetota bacterium]|nr:nicotinate-nucleotide--dimethylbenzimidazole phosphoribosyltransferase [Actinomycetota bacterium]